jgi:AFG3 family protein
MIFFSKLNRSISRSKGFLYGGGVRSAARLLTSPGLEAASVNEVEGGLGFIRRHFASLASRKGLVNNDLIGVFANPRLRRFFSDEAPKKKSMFAKMLNHF